MDPDIETGVELLELSHAMMRTLDNDEPDWDLLSMTAKHIREIAYLTIGIPLPGTEEVV